ncbi:hypothetical protein ACFOHS_19345 [Jhaorihella thermophila]
MQERFRGSRAKNDLDDLAFAPVTVGRRTGECASRLGLPTSLAYVEALRGSPSLEFVYVQRSRFMRLDVELLSGRLDKARGGLFADASEKSGGCGPASEGD